VGWFSPYLAPESPLAVQATALMILIGGAAIVYFAAAFGSGGADIGMIRRSIRRGSASATAPSKDQ
jgi:putative peptidoglycan lipid II flippase